ncbi:hypothetical protein JD969_03340 [Planctomycetota bacterium]|nr:hypothetical protein JD969_03340 [Planctomycetota bacterium]
MLNFFSRTTGVFVCCLMMVGCTLPKGNYHFTQTETLEPVVMKNTQVKVGEEMLKVGYMIEYDAIYLEREAVVRSGQTWGYKFSPGYYVKTGEDKRYSYYEPAKGKRAGNIKVSKSTIPFWAMQVDKQEHTLYGVSVFTVKEQAKDAKFRFCKLKGENEDVYMQTLTYMGLEEDVLTLVYNVYEGNLVKPTHMDVLKVEMSEYTIVEHEGAKLRIIAASDEHIEYEVLSYFSE